MVHFCKPDGTAKFLNQDALPHASQREFFAVVFRDSIIMMSYLKTLILVEDVLVEVWILLICIFYPVHLQIVRPISEQQRGLLIDDSEVY